jgi:hypothetical protein
MKETIQRLENLMKRVNQLLSEVPMAELEEKVSLNKWSKKEIMGHLVDSALHNLQRFTQIQFEPKPYKVIPYDQDQMVLVNDYQNVLISNISELWLSLNRQIIHVLKALTSEALHYEVVINKNEFKDLQWLIVDYVDHLEYHIKQIEHAKELNPQAEEAYH